jgi:gliding motility-associated-like protein
MNRYLAFVFLFFALVISEVSWGQCAGTLEPGFQFLTSSKGCAPYTVTIETRYLSSIAGTVYYVDWGDGSGTQTFTQVNATGVTVSHLYPNTSSNCGYDIVIDASNACNPQGSVAKVNTQVIVWTNDVVSIDPQVFRVCQGFAETLSFTDNSTWNCFPRPARENNAPRWIQWIYGTGPVVTQIPGVQVNGVSPGGFPYLDPGAGRNPIYPVVAPGQISLPINVPVTLPADVGKEFDVTLNNWNQCNAYDNNLLDGNAFNPVSGDLVNGDNPAQTIMAKIVIVPSPQPTFVTRLGNAGGPLQSIFCVGDNIFFDDQTPSIGGASFGYTWQFFDNSTGAGAPIATSNSPAPVFDYLSAGVKLIRLLVKDKNAAGGCVNSYDGLVTISPSLVSKIQTTDLSNAPLVPNFCQNSSAPFSSFQVRFNDVSVGSAIATTEWQWQFYDENNALILQVPAVGYSSTALGPFDRTFINRGIYHVKLIIHDSATGCQTEDDVEVHVYENPVPAFTASRACEGQANSFKETSTLNPINGESIVLREWDFNYNGVVFNKDPAYDNHSTFTRVLGPAATYSVALRVTTDQNSCSAIFVLPVVVDPLPVATFTPDVTSGCSVLTVNFTNTSIPTQPDVVDRYVWEIDQKLGLGFQPVATQQPTDPAFSNQFVYQFENTGNTNAQQDVRLHVYTVHGCENISVPVTLTIFPGTKSGFNSVNYSPFNNNCSPQSVNFNVDAATQALSPTDYTWTVSDSNGVLTSSSTGTTPAFTYNFINSTQSIEDFSVKLVTTLPGGCFGDSVRTIRISPVPTSLFTIDTLQYDCDVMNINLVASQQGLSTYHWVVNENGTVVSDVSGSASQFQFSFNRVAADIAVQFFLDTKNLANCNSTVTSQNLTIPKKDNMNVSFTASPASQSLPASTVTLVNGTNAGAWTYLWDFGDGTTSTDPNVGTHTYATYGTYIIKLTVSNTICVQSQSQQVIILPIPPQVDFSYTPQSGCEPLTVQFTNLTKFADPSTYAWDFGDGGTSHDSDPTHTYTHYGNFSVSLSASNIAGKTVTETKLSAIDVFVRPVASFKINPPVLYIPGGILYTANLSANATGFLWDFGDGETATDVRPEHLYKKDGTFTITLVASNEFNCTDTARIVDAVLVKKANEVLIPNAFSPGSGSNGGIGGAGDGKNDVFLPLMRGVTDFELLIYNRWGQLLFETRDATVGWDGYYQGKLCEQDVYMYKLTAVLQNGEKLVRVGDVNLIR